ncbi:MAG: hypothetical protein HYT80_02330 [Euryarchaeota archaeon]|nr:hypothetical protein [Euryarchaeota archaeon]
MAKTPVVLAVIALLLSGCSGGGKANEASPSESPLDTSTPSEAPDEQPDTFDPKFHEHDYWADRPKVLLFSGPVELSRDALSEMTVDQYGVTIGSKEFDTKTDGDHSGLSGDQTDVVFQGTSHIEAKFQWTDTNQIPGLRFSFKHAATPTFTLVGPVESGKVYRIDLVKYMADMPHQLSLSRWKFRLDAFTPQTDTLPFEVNYAKGNVQVEMWIYNGGGRFIDPPHPYFFTKSTTRYGGEVNVTLKNCVVVNDTKIGAQQNPLNPMGINCPNAKGPIDLRAEPPHIIPWEATKAVIQLWYNVSGYPGDQKPPIELGLKFHGSDHTKYQFPGAKEKRAGYALYEVGVTEAMTDSPYATQSDWMFGVYPIVQGVSDYGGEFSGGIHIHVTSLKEGDTTGRGMGN